MDTLHDMMYYLRSDVSIEMKLKLIQGLYNNADIDEDKDTLEYLRQTIAELKGELRINRVVF